MAGGGQPMHEKLDVQGCARMCKDVEIFHLSRWRIGSDWFGLAAARTLTDEVDPPSS
jgi:hypothetical protein